MNRFTHLLVLCLAGCAQPDALIGSYDFTITSGTDTNTAPNNNTSTPMGLGTLAVTPAAKLESYILTVAQLDSAPCRLTATKGKEAGTATVDPGQMCTFKNAFGSVTATVSTGTVSLKEPALSLELRYSYAGVVLGINYAGMGQRVYSGPRL